MGCGRARREIKEQIRACSGSESIDNNQPGVAKIHSAHERRIMIYVHFVAFSMQVVAQQFANVTVAVENNYFA